MHVFSFKWNRVCALHLCMARVHQRQCICTIACRVYESNTISPERLNMNELKRSLWFAFADLIDCHIEIYTNWSDLFDAFHIIYSYVLLQFTIKMDFDWTKLRSTKYAGETKEEKKNCMHENGYGTNAIFVAVSLRWFKEWKFHDEFMCLFFFAHRDRVRCIDPR